VEPFTCQFAVGQDGVACSAVWWVGTAKNKPDLYIAVRSLSGELKATVHAPHPPHAGWFRKFGFDMKAASPVSQQAKRDGGPHKVQWTGCELAPNVTLEYRVIIRGASLEEVGEPVDRHVMLLPVPSINEYVEVDVILGPKGATRGHPRERDGETYLLSEGRLSDDRRIWIVHIVRPIKPKEVIPAPIEPNRIGSRAHLDPNADLSSGGLRAIALGEQSDGSLAFWDLKASWRPTEGHRS